MKTNAKFHSYIHWGLLTLFFGYQYLLRGSLSIFTDEIRRSFLLDSEQFANLAVYCMLAYSCLQIPFGILLDRIGIRRLVLPSLGLCVLGQYLFSNASSYSWAMAGRILIGIGGVPAYIGTIKLIVDFFVEKSSLFIGISSALGIVLVMVFNPLLKWVGLQCQSWEAAAGLLAHGGAILWILCYLFLRPEQRAAMNDSGTRFLSSIKSVLLNYRIYICAVFVIGTNIIAMTLADLWGPSFLTTKYAVSELQGVSYTQLIYTGCTIGTLILAILFNGLNKILVGIRLSCIALLGILCLLTYGSASLPPMYLQMALFFLGIFGSADVLAFSLGAHMSTPQTAGMTASVINSLGMLGEPLLQWTVGKVLNASWDGTMDGKGLRLYTAAHYESACGIFVKIALFALIVACLYRAKKEPKTRLA